MLMIKLHIGQHECDVIMVVWIWYSTEMQGINNFIFIDDGLLLYLWYSSSQEN